MFYSWLVFQVLVGIWVFISPLIFGFEESWIGTNNMIFGAIVVLLGIGSIIHEFYHEERSERQRLPRPEHAEGKA